jgi:hypothetical protein
MGHAASHKQPNECSNSACDNVHPLSDGEWICPRCHENVGTINVRRAKSEQGDLLRRYAAAQQNAQTQNRDAPFLHFLDTVKQSSQVAITLDLKTLCKIVEEEGAYENTYRLRQSGRKPRSLSEQAGHRRAVDALFFDDYYEEIHFGALTLDKKGALSYGACTILLNNKASKNRVSFTTRNTFHMAFENTASSNGSIRPDLPFGHLPVGHRATWETRGELACAKIEPQLTPTTSETDFPNLLLKQGTGKADDDFIEAHIYGPVKLTDLKAAYLDPLRAKTVDQDALDELNDTLQEGTLRWKVEVLP